MGWNIATAVLAAGAAVTNAVVAAHLWRTPLGGTNHWAIWHTVAGIGAALYAAMFLQLIFDNDVDRAAWSQRLTPGSAVAFFAIWTVPALIHHVTRPDP